MIKNFAKDNTIESEVVEERKVKFEEEILSFSNAELILLIVLFDEG